MATSATAAASPTRRQKRRNCGCIHRTLGCAFAEWRDTKINLLDTPGFLDFQGDAIAGLVAADGALCVIGATAGVEVGTERMFREAVARRDPVLFVVSMMDKEHANFDAIYRQVKSRLTAKVIPIEVPVGEGTDFHGIVNLFDKKAHVYARGARTGAYEETDVPPEVQPQFDRYYAELIETVAATDDTLLERYLNGEEISRDDAITAMKAAMQRMELFPLFCVSSLHNYGTRAVLSHIVDLMPNAYEMEETHRLQGCRRQQHGGNSRGRQCTVRRPRLQDAERAACRRGERVPRALGRGSHR